MNRTGKTLLVAAIVSLALLLPAAGCAKKVPVTTTTTATTEPATSTTSGSGSSEEPTTPATQTEAVSTGPISTPAVGSVTRTALMDAARAKLATGSQFVVYQLFVQGDYAIGDLEMVSGGARNFVAWKKAGSAWEAVWATPYGSADASAASAKAAAPGLSDELLAKIDWKFKKPASSAEMKSSLSAAAKKWAKTMMEGRGEPYQVTTVKVAQDSKGTWWGRVVVQPSPDGSNAYESIEFWCKYSGGAWKGNAQDPEPPAPTTYFPASVVGALGL